LGRAALLFRRPRQHLEYERARTFDAWQVIDGGMAAEGKPGNLTAGNTEKTEKQNY